MSTINERIAALIKDQGLKRSEFAERLHVSGPFISMVCSGSKTPSDRTVSDICREFGVSLAWLQGGVGEMYVRRSANEELGLLVADLMAEADDSFRKRFTSALLSLPSEFWPGFEAFLKKIAGDE